MEGARGVERKEKKEKKENGERKKEKKETRKKQSVRVRRKKEYMVPSKTMCQIRTFVVLLSEEGQENLEP